MWSQSGLDGRVSRFKAHRQENYNYPNLRKLHLSLLGAENPEREDFFEPTEMLPSLVSLHLQSLKLASPTWRALAAHPRLMLLRNSDQGHGSTDILGNVRKDGESHVR